MSQLVEILMRWQRGESLRAIAGSLAISRNTVREYVRTAETAGLPREPAVSHEALTGFVSEHFPAAAGRGTSVLWRRELDVRREEIAEGLKTNRVGTVWARMHAAGRIKASLSTLRRYVRQELPAPVDPLDRPHRKTPVRPEADRRVRCPPCHAAGRRGWASRPRGGS